MKLYKLLVVLIVLSSNAVAQTSVPTQNEINLYTTREPKLIKPLLDAFSLKTGILVKTSFVKDGMVEKLKAENERSPADVLMTADIGNLIDLEQNGAFQSIDSNALRGV